MLRVWRAPLSWAILGMLMALGVSWRLEPRSRCEAPEISWCEDKYVALTLSTPGYEVRVEDEEEGGPLIATVTREGERSTRFRVTEEASELIRERWLRFSGGMRLLHVANHAHQGGFGFPSKTSLVLHGDRGDVVLDLGDETYGNKALYVRSREHPEWLMLFEPDSIRRLKHADRRIFRDNPWGVAYKDAVEVAIRTPWGGELGAHHHRRHEPELQFWQLHQREGRGRHLTAWLGGLWRIRGKAPERPPGDATLWVTLVVNGGREVTVKHWEGVYWAEWGQESVRLEAGAGKLLEGLPRHVKRWREEQAASVPAREAHKH